jgi:hypothetical protein
MMAKPNRQGAVYRRKAKEVKAAATVCALCGRPIDHSLRYPHPASGSADHINAVNSGGDMLGSLQAVHLVCNLRRKDSDTGTVDFSRPLEYAYKSHPPAAKRYARPVHSQDWW